MTPMTPVLPGSPQLPEVVFAKDQPEYLPLPACVVQYQGGEIAVVTRWRLSLRERLRVLFGGSFWLQQMTFGHALQPQLPSTIEPVLSVKS